MNPIQVFDDLPQIHLGADGQFTDAYPWPVYADRDASWTGARSHPRVVNVLGSELVLDNPKTQPMSNMQRYLSGPERPLFNAEVLQLESTRGQRERRLDFDPEFEPRGPWPYPGEPQKRFQDTYRSSWSVSSCSSYNYSQPDDLSATSFSSPDASSPTGEYASQETAYVDYRPFRTYPFEESTVGGSCALREIQQYPSASEDPEQPMDYEDCSGMKMEYASCEQETIYYHGKIEPDNQRYSHVHDDDAVRVRDAESVKPCIKVEDDADSEYDPTNSSTKRHRRRVSQSSVSSKGSTRRSSNARRSGTTSTPSDNRRVSKKSKASSSAKDSSASVRPFQCPFAGYSCSSTFASKNEWKRHVSTQHIRLGFWRCELCPSTVDDGVTVSFNDFNRKDLFAQHLRRMHFAGPPSNSKSAAARAAFSAPGKDNPVTEENMAEYQNRCYQKLRDPPPQSSCLFCNHTFQGPGSWDERMEHVGRHFEKDKKGDDRVCGVARWREDAALQLWLRREGLVELDERGAWQLGDGMPKKGKYNVVGGKRRNADEDDD